MGINVKDYGAVGDGVTNDSTAIQNALNAVPASGGIVFFPAGNYLVPNGGLVINNLTRLIGAGPFGFDINTFNYTTGGSTVVSTSSTTDLLTINAAGCSFDSIGFKNTSGTTPTAGTGVKLANAGTFDMHNVAIAGFWNLVEIKNGLRWSISSFNFWAPVNYGIYIHNPGNTDTGDAALSNGTICSFSNGCTGIYYTSSGGLKISNIKINPGNATKLLNCINLNVEAPGTSDLLISNSSFEGFAGNGVLAALQSGASFSNILITGSQFYPAGTITGNCINITGINNLSIAGNDFLDGSSNTRSAILLTNCNYGVVYPNSNKGWTTLFTQSGGSNISYLPNTVAPNTFFAGLSAGGNAVPSFRALTLADFQPVTDGRYGQLGAVNTWTLRNIFNQNITGVAGSGLYINAYYSGGFKYNANGYANLIYQDASGNFQISSMVNNASGGSGAAGTEVKLWQFQNAGQLVPNINNAYDIGTSANGVRNVYISGSASVQHLKGKGVAPTIVVGASAGTGATSSITGTDAAGAIIVTTGASPVSASGIVATITFNTAYSTAPYISLTPYGAAAIPIFISISQTNLFSVGYYTGTLAPNTTYEWHYLIMG